MIQGKYRYPKLAPSPPNALTSAESTFQGGIIRGILRPKLHRLCDFYDSLSQLINRDFVIFPVTG